MNVKQGLRYWTLLTYSSGTLFTKKMVEKVKLRQIKAQIYFLRIFQQKYNFGENLTSRCHGYAFVGVMSKSTNLAKITVGFHGNLVT